jgi:predicted CXXCH cytochrome family protein
LQASQGGEGELPEADPIVMPPETSPKVQSEICGQCHSEFLPVDPRGFWIEGLTYRAGEVLGNSHQIVNFEGPAYDEFREKFEHTFWSDGTCRVGGDEYNALIESPCYKRGELSCLSCHSMHESDPNDMLKAKMDGDHACVQCHTESRFTDKIEEHTHHPAQSSGSRCYNCHMPYTSYALMTALRSHRVTSPRVEPIVGRAQPNACNLCHLDQTLAWASGHLADWHGVEEPLLADDEQEVAASLLWLLRGDGAQRALAAWHTRWAPAKEASGDDWQAPFLSYLLNDPYAGVRYQAVRSLEGLPALADWKGDFLADEKAQREAQAKAIDAWRRAGGARPRDERESLLLQDAASDYRVDEVEKLLKRRDDTFVKINE